MSPPTCSGNAMRTSELWRSHLLGPNMLLPFLTSSAFSRLAGMATSCTSRSQRAPAASWSSLHCRHPYLSPSARLPLVACSINVARRLQWRKVKAHSTILRKDERMSRNNGPFIVLRGEVGLPHICAGTAPGD